MLSGVWNWHYIAIDLRLDVRLRGRGAGIDGADV